MSRYYGYVLITFVDGTTDRIGGNQARVHDGQLVVVTERTYGGPPRDVRYLPLANIREWHWEDE